MINRNTYDGDLEEIESVRYINTNKILYNNYFKLLNLDINTSFVVRVSSNRFSELSKKIVKTRSDAYAITNCSQRLIDFINKNKYVDENILLTYKDEYTFVPQSGISIKLPDSQKYQILKLTPKSFFNLFSNFELGAGASLFCKRDNELYKNEALLSGWFTNITKMKECFLELNLSNDFLQNKKECQEIKSFSENKIRELILTNNELKKKIFNGAGLYEEPYTAYYFYQNKTISPLNFIDFLITTGSGRSRGDYTIVLKPK